MRAQYVVVESEDSGERYAERMRLQRANPVLRGRVLAERYMETGERVRIGAVLSDSTDDAMHDPDIKWFCGHTVGVAANDNQREDFDADS